MDFQLADGRKIKLSDFTMRETYEGLLEGTPARASARLREQGLEELARARHWDRLATHVVDPGSAELPQVLCTAWFKCFTDPDPDVFYSQLLVAWFVDDHAGDVREIVARGIDGLDWTAHADVVRHDDY